MNPIQEVESPVALGAVFKTASADVHPNPRAAASASMLLPVRCRM